MSASYAAVPPPGKKSEHTSPQELNNALLAAVVARQYKRVLELLDQGANINTQQAKSQNTPLHIAVKNDDPGMVLLLLEKQADRQVLNNNRRTPLQIIAPVDYQLFAEETASASPPKREIKKIFALYIQHKLVSLEQYLQGQDHENHWTDNLDDLLDELADICVQHPRLLSQLYQHEIARCSNPKLASDSEQKEEQDLVRSEELRPLTKVLHTIQHNTWSEYIIESEKTQKAMQRINAAREGRLIPPPQKLIPEQQASGCCPGFFSRKWWQRRSNKVAPAAVVMSPEKEKGRGSIHPPNRAATFRAQKS